jgi:plasmid stabilization system protein ParE
MHVRVISPAQDEIAESPSAAVRFFGEFDRLKALVGSNPNIGRLADNGLRRFPFRHLPFDLVYEVRPDEVVVTMVAHHRRTHLLNQTAD